MVDCMACVVHGNVLQLKNYRPSVANIADHSVLPTQSLSNKSHTLYKAMSKLPAVGCDWWGLHTRSLLFAQTTEAIVLFYLWHVSTWVTLGTLMPAEAF